MNLGIDKNLKIVEKFCLNPAGCPFQKECITYEDRKQKCSNCKNTVDKVDLVDVLKYLYTSSPTSTKTTKRTGTGKNTELSKTEIKKILLLHKEGMNINQISNELHLQFRTVKNVVNKSFKNSLANQRVEEVEKKLESN